MDGRTFVRHEIYRYQTAGPRSANFSKHMHVNKISSPINFRIINKKSNVVHLEVRSWLMSRKTHQIWPKLRLTTIYVDYGLWIDILRFEVGTL